MKANTDEELKERGLTDEAIWIVRNANDNATVLAETMGKVTYRIAVLYYTYDSAKKITSLATNATWEWSTRPVQTFNDIIGVGTSENFKKDSGETKVYYYKNGNKSSTKITSTFDLKTANSGLNAFSSFPALKVVYPGHDPADKYYAMKGECRTDWSVSGNIKTVGIACNYGHTIISCTPALSTSKGGVGISFTPEWKIDQGTEDYMPVNRK